MKVLLSALVFAAGLGVGISCVALGFAAYQDHEQATPLTASTIDSPVAPIDSQQNTTVPPPATPDAVRIPILIYHTVHPDRPDETAEQRQFNVTPDAFGKQLQYLADHGYTVISMDQLVADVKTGTTSPIAKPVVITLDDGARSQYDYAFPLLKKFGDTATFYVYTNPLNTKNEYFVSWDDVKEMAAAGMTIGSHSVDHPYLTKEDPAKVQEELEESKSQIERQTGQPVRHFATPFGATNAAVQAAIKAAGYETSRSTNRGTYHAKGDLLTLTGYFVPTDMATFEWIVNKAK